MTFVATSIGGAVFSLLLYIRRDFRHKGLMMFAGTITAGIIGILLPLISNFLLFLSALILLGLTFGININLLNIILQTKVDKTYLGRVYSFFQFRLSGNYGLVTVVDLEWDSDYRKE